MFSKKKGQGALEYLLLIGGAVLIAVIVIALLVGMGGQSRDTAKEQADRVQQATDVPQPAQIVSVAAAYANCNTTTGVAQIDVFWRPLGEGGSHELKVLDSRNIEQQIRTGTNAYENSMTLNPNELDILNIDVNITTAGKCGDSYYVQIITEKNNQTVPSSRYKFSWSN